jgi:hypothetical protein
MAIGMLLIGGLMGHPETYQGNNGTGSIGKVIQGICGDGDGACQNTNQQFHGKQQQVAADAHKSRQRTDGGPDRKSLRIPVIFNEEPKQKICHDFPPEKQKKRSFWANSTGGRVVFYHPGQQKAALLPKNGVTLRRESCMMVPDKSFSQNGLKPFYQVFHFYRCQAMCPIAA